jgi:2-polyprenyl-3-methyl-5-hydroxy-6-metoxy-1,4-benzoquinol methylase
MSDIEVPDIPQVERKEEDKPEENISTIKSVTTKLKKTVNLELFLPEIYEWIFEKLKKGPTLVIGDKIGKLSEKIAKLDISVTARDMSSSYVSPKSEVSDEKILEKMDFKPFTLSKMSELSRFNLNVILIFALEKLTKSQKMELLKECKRLMAKEGQLIVVGEYLPKSVLLYPISLVKGFINLINTKVFKRKTRRPIRNFEKLAIKTELKFFDVKYDANGRIRTYVLTKRWGALLR